jgi:hypothetical protein
MVKPIVCAALLIAVLAHPAVSVIEDGSIYEDYLDIGDVQLVKVYQGSSTTFSVSATNHGNLCYGGAILKYPRDLPEGITISPVESQIIDIEYVVFRRGICPDAAPTAHASADREGYAGCRRDSYQTGRGSAGD